MTTIDAGSLVAGRYRLEERLDAGGRAQVWRTHDQELDRTVAVKIVTAPEAEDPAFLDAFREQARLEARMKHPGIVEVFDWGHDGPLNYVVMEFLEGESLRRLLDSGPLAADRVIAIGRQAAAALAYAHAEGVAHGSITPAHVVVAPSGDAKLIDFGLQCHGICEYPAVPDSDTFALGQLLYEALVGTQPSHVPPADHPKDEPWPANPRKINSSVPADLDRVVMKAIAPNPADRYATAAELQAALDAFVAPMSNAAIWTLLLIMAVAIAAISTYYFSTRPQIIVPDVAGMTSAAAQATLSATGLKMTVTGQTTSANIPAGSVIAETPSPGSKVRRDSTISVSLSTGKPFATIPSVIGLTLQAGTSVLTRAGLALGRVTTQSNTTFASNTIIAQTPAVGATLAAGMPIDLVVSSGTAQVTVPDLGGLTASQARSKLSSLGLAADVGTTYSSLPNGSVVSQGPAPGSTVAVGSTVTVSVSAGQQPLRVPNVVGAQSAAATTILQNLGLVPVSIPTSGTTAQLGTVISQSPSAKSRVQPGSRVKIYVGQ